MSNDMEIGSAPDGGTPQPERLRPSWVRSRRFVPRAFVQPALKFMRDEAAGGMVMLVAAVVAIAWANSPLGESYFELFGARIEIVLGDLRFHHLSELTVREWINDAVMVVFFFVVGLEIKREMVLGELRDPRAAALPAVAALGGMLGPALLYTWFNTGLLDGGVARGWGVPMATDIAFAMGVIALVGRRVPVQAKLFLLALAIVDDLGAILVIALFYTSDLAFGWLLAAGGGLLAMFVMRRWEVRSVPAYLMVGAFIWLAVLESGVHATIAGVAIALLTPVTSFYDTANFPRRARDLVDRIDSHLPATSRGQALDHHSLARIQSLVQELRRLANESIPPLERFEYALARWSAFVIVPLFALANAGVVISGDAVGGALRDPVMMGIFVGLVVGKVVGVTGFAWLAIRLGIGRMPPGTTWSHMVGVGLLAGIGFTVALFVAALSFAPGSAALDSAKIGIFGASAVAGTAGFVFLRFVAPHPDQVGDEADALLDAGRAPA